MFKRFMLSKIMSYGTIAGFVVGIPMFVLAVATQGLPPMPYGMVIGYLTMLVALSTVFVAIKRHRDVDRGGIIGFWPAFGLGLGISFVASLFYVAAWEITIAFTHVDFGAFYANMLIEEKKAKGVSGEALAQFTKQMQQFVSDYANPLYRLPMTFTEIFPVGVLVSLVAAALFRNRRFLALQRTQ